MATDKVRVQNQGKRTIHIGPGKKIVPKEQAYVSIDEAKKLLRLYPYEVINLDAPIAPGGDGVKDLTPDAPAVPVATEVKKPANGGKTGGKTTKVEKVEEDASGDSEDDKLADALKEDAKK